jgi:hypothetical protein
MADLEFFPFRAGTNRQRKAGRTFHCSWTGGNVPGRGPGAEKDIFGTLAPGLLGIAAAACQAARLGQVTRQKLSQERRQVGGPRPSPG